MATLTSFEELDCWKACREVVRWVMMITKTFPKHEQFDLADNMRRAARSSTRNIAEGFGRHHHKENIQHCRIARGSLYEVIDDAITAKEENYLNGESYQNGREIINKAIALLNGYINYLRRLN